jgi:hypothetical protein
MPKSQASASTFRESRGQRPIRRSLSSEAAVPGGAGRWTEQVNGYELSLDLAWASPAGDGLGASGKLARRGKAEILKIL